MHTGNTGIVLSRCLFSAVYPCAYREHVSSFVLFISTSGLSLCIQGTHLYSHNQFYPHRFIPVHTGNTRTEIVNRALVAVYPCAYREHCIATQSLASDPRFIPVHTGNTSLASITAVLIPVYPCAYREHYNYNLLFYN